MESDNSFFCEECNEKVSTIKRQYFNKLPHYLTFHLNRFEFDFAKEEVVKLD